MTRVRPLRPEEVGPDLKEAIDKQREQVGLVPESLLTMAHRPGLARAWAALGQEIVASGSVDPALKQLVAYVASTAHGCRYCQAHTAQNVVRRGVEADKLRDAWSYETSPRFTDAERDALRLAHHAALVPNETTDEHFERLRRWYSDEQIVEIVAVIAMFGFLNRWNDTMATTIEEPALAFAERELAPATGWHVGQHGRPQPPG